MSMTALAVIAALVTALCVGYHFGQRAGSTPLTWKERTSRAALCRHVLSLIVLITARRVQQSSFAGRVPAYALVVRGLKATVHDHAPGSWITPSCWPLPTRLTSTQRLWPTAR